MGHHGARGRGGEPDRRAVIGRRHLHALHRRVAAGILAEQLVPDIEAGRDVPDSLQQWQQPVLVLHVGLQLRGGPQTENRMIVVDQQQLAI